MEWKKLAPWNWFKKEEEHTGRTRALGRRGSLGDPLAVLHGEVDRWFEQMLRRLPGGAELAGSLLRPSLDISEGRSAYKIEVEIPGVDPGDVTLAVEGDTLVIRGEKRHEREENDEHVHCIERSYGAFERLLSLPDDADADRIEARFRKGVLRIRIPKRGGSKPAGHRVPIAGE